MWIITKEGFISLVVDKRDPSMLQVRARVAEDITRNFPGAVVYAATAADYRYRARVKRTEVALVLAQQVLDMDYISHFKDVALANCPNPPSRQTAYYGTWGAMAKMQDYGPYSKLSREEVAKLPKTYKGYGSGGLYEGGDYYDGHGWGRQDWKPEEHVYKGKGSSLPDNWTLSDLPDSDLDVDVPDEDPEITEAIDDALAQFGKVSIDALSEDEWEELITTIVKENREKAKAKALMFTPRQSPAKRRRRRRRGGRGQGS